MRKILLLLLLAVLALLTVTWTFSSPQSTMNGITAAVDSGDAERLHQWVDLSAVQRSLAQQYAQFLALKMQNDPDWQGARSSGLDESLAQRLVAEAITPEGLLKLLQGDHQVLMGRLNADNVSAETLRTPLNRRTDQQEENHSLFRHSLRLTDKRSYEPLMILTVGFNGVTWRLTSVQIPMWGKLYED